MLDVLLDIAHHHTAVNTIISHNILQAFVFNSHEETATTMLSLIKSVPSLAIIALLVQPSPASFLRAIPMIVGGIGTLGNIIGNIGDPQGSVEPSMNNTVDYETVHGIQRISSGEPTAPVPNQLAWQICRGNYAHLCLTTFPHLPPPPPKVRGLPPSRASRPPKTSFHIQSSHLIRKVIPC